jgi:hypothetical protein
LAQNQSYARFRIKNYVEVQDLPKTVGMGHEIWDHIRQTPYLKQQVHDGVYAWYARNQERLLICYCVI